jgi:hypothetical protein
MGLFKNHMPNDTALVLHYYEQLKKGCPDYWSYKKWKSYCVLGELKGDENEIEMER